MAGFRPKNFVQLIRRNSRFTFAFSGRSSNYEATGNVFILFQYPSMNSNHKNPKIQTKIFGLKLKKILGGNPCLFFNFLTKKLLFEFSGFYDLNLSINTKNN